MKTTDDLYLNKAECCGCEMCANICPKKIIKMKEDEQGFFYPDIPDSSLCINCNACQKCCPVKNIDNVDSEFIDYYAGSLKDNCELASCASGGIATQISKEFIKASGIVYGAGYTPDFYGVKYLRVDTIQKLNELKTSKYAQARKESIYYLISQDLKEKKRVLFIGLPCDVFAVNHMFSAYDNLYTIELVCHGPTSCKVQREYCKNLEEKYHSSLQLFSSRYKKNKKWFPFYINAVFQDGKHHLEKFHDSSYGACFIYLKRPSCYHCQFKDNKLSADIMIGDYHYVEKGMAGYNSGGVSIAIVHTYKGKELIDCCNPSEIELVKISRRGGLANSAIHHPISVPKNQQKFQSVFVSAGLNKASKQPFVVITRAKSKIKTSCQRQ